MDVGVLCCAVPAAPSRSRRCVVHDEGQGALQALQNLALPMFAALHPPSLSRMAHATGQDHDILTHMTGVLPPSVPVRRLQQEPRKKGQYQATLEDLEDEFATRGGLAGMEDERAFRQPAAEEEAKPKRRRIAVTPNQTAVLQAMLAQVRRPPARLLPYADPTVRRRHFPPRRSGTRCRCNSRCLPGKCRYVPPPPATVAPSRH